MSNNDREFAPYNPVSVLATMLGGEYKTLSGGEEFQGVLLITLDSEFVLQCDEKQIMIDDPQVLTKLAQ